MFFIVPVELNSSDINLENVSLVDTPIETVVELGIFDVSTFILSVSKPGADEVKVVVVPLTLAVSVLPSRVAVEVPELYAKANVPAF